MFFEEAEIIIESGQAACVCMLYYYFFWAITNDAVGPYFVFHLAQLGSLRSFSLLGNWVFCS